MKQPQGPEWPKQSGESPFVLPCLFVVLVAVAAMGGNLAADFAARETSCMHIRISGSGTERTDEASEVVQIEGLIGGRAMCVQGNDVGGGRRAADRTGCGLRAVGLLRNVRVPFGSAAEKCHHRISGAFKTEMNVGDLGRAAQARPGERPTQCGSVF